MTSTKTRTYRKSVGAVTVIALLPLLYLLIRLLGARWFPTGDNAMLVLRINDVGTLHTPLLGPYSRYGWNHPGPLMFYLLAIPYRLSGASTWGVLAGCVAVNMACAATMVHLVWTHARASAAAIVAGGLALMTWALSPYVVESPWNPDITVFPFALFITAVWATRIDNRWLPLSLGLGTYLVESHAGFAPPVVVLCAWNVVGVWKNRPSKKTWIITAVVLALCWLPVAIDEAFGEHNINLLISFFATSDLVQVGMVRSLGVASRELAGFAPWMGGPIPFVEDVNVRPIWQLVFPLAAYAAAVVLTKRREQRVALQFLVAVGLAIVACTFAVSRITDGVGYYLVQFWTPLAMLFWAAVVSGLLSCIPTKWLKAEWVERGTITALAGGTAVVAIFSSIAMSHSQVPTPLVQSAIANTFPAAIANVKDAESVYIEAHGINGGWIKDALCLELVRQHKQCLVDEPNKNKVGGGRVGSAQAADAFVVIAIGEEVRSTARDPANRSIATWSGPSGAHLATTPSIRILQGPPNEQLVIFRHI